MQKLLSTDSDFMRIKSTPPFLILFLAAVVFTIHTYAVPSSLTFQTKIYKPNGTALEAASVSFRFTTVDPTGTCILYVEDFSGMNMQASVGLAVFSLGTGSNISCYYRRSRAGDSCFGQDHKITRRTQIDRFYRQSDNIGCCCRIRCRDNVGHRTGKVICCDPVTLNDRSYFDVTSCRRKVCD